MEVCSLCLSLSVSFFYLCLSLPFSVLWSSSHVSNFVHVSVSITLWLSVSVSFSCLCVVCLPPHTSVYLSVSPRLSSHAWCFLCNHPSCLCLSVCLQLLDSVSLSTSLPMFCCPHISLSLPTIHSLPLISCLPSSGAGGPATDAGETRAGSLGAEEAG